MTRAKWKVIAARNRVEERPASFGYFTIKQLAHIIYRVRQNSQAKVHYFTFGKLRFRVNVYDPDPEDTFDPENLIQTTPLGD